MQCPKILLSCFRARTSDLRLSGKRPPRLDRTVRPLLLQDIVVDGVVEALPGDVRRVRLDARVVDLRQFGGESLAQRRHVVSGHVELQ